MSDTAARVVALSGAKLALLNLRMREGMGARERGAADAAAPARAPIPRLARHAEANLVDELDQMGDAQIDRLLRQTLVDEQRAPARRAAKASRPDAIPRVARDREVEILAGLEGLSDAEVDSLVRDLMPDVSAGFE